MGHLYSITRVGERTGLDPQKIFFFRIVSNLDR
jgi:hypothetical protein